MENLENRKVGTKTKEKQRERVNVDRQTDIQTYLSTRVKRNGRRWRDRWG